MYKIGICDDNIAVGAEIEKYLLECASTENFEDIEIEVFLSGENLCRAIRNNSNIFHLLFLFKVRPMDFLIKPITYNKIYDIMQIYRNLFSGKKMFFEYKKGRNSYQIAQSEIICIKCEGKKICLVTNREEIMFYGKMADVSKQLDSVKFWTIHKSFIINVDFVFSFGRDEIRMMNGDKLPVSKTYKKEVANQILRLQFMKRERENK